MWYSQNDPAWKSWPLGKGPDTIGADGCLLTSGANMAHFMAGANTNPGGLSGFLLNQGRFIQGELLADNFMDGLFGCHYVGSKHYESTAADLSYPSDDPSIQTIVEIDADIHTGGVQTHFVLYYDGHTAANFRIVDSWDGTVKYLKAYGDPATIIQKFVTYRVDKPAPAPAPVPAPAPAPTPTTAPKPVETPPAPQPATDTPPATNTPPAAPQQPTEPAVSTVVIPTQLGVWLAALKQLIAWLKQTLLG